MMLYLVQSNVFMRFKVQKTHYFPHTVHYFCSSILCLSETRRVLQSSSFWEARRALIGQLSSALWLAEYLKRETEMLRPLPYCDAVSHRDGTKPIKAHYKQSICSIQWGDNYWLYCLFIHRVASCCVNISMSAFVIREMTNNKRYSTLLKTRVWIVSSKFFK